MLRLCRISSAWREEGANPALGGGLKMVLATPAKSGRNWKVSNPAAKSSRFATSCWRCFNRAARGTYVGSEVAEGSISATADLREGSLNRRARLVLFATRASPSAFDRDRSRRNCGRLEAHAVRPSLAPSERRFAKARKKQPCREGQVVVFPSMGQFWEVSTSCACPACVLVAYSCCACVLCTSRIPDRMYREERENISSCIWMWG